MLLPAPLGPSRPKISPGATSSDTPGERDALAVALGDVARDQRRYVSHAATSTPVPDAAPGATQVFFGFDSDSAFGLESDEDLDSAFFSFALSAIFASCLSAPSLADFSSSRARRFVP